MPVESKHKLYDTLHKTWQKCRCTIDGSEAVKAAGQEYLPKLSGQNDPDYLAYKMRANFFAAAQRTAEAVKGMLFAKEPVVKFPDNERVSMKEVGSDGSDLLTFTKHITDEVLRTGRFGVLTDANTTADRFYLAGYKAEQIYNWKTLKYQGKEILVMVVLGEVHMDYTSDPFAGVPKDRIRVLRLGRLQGEGPEIAPRYIVDLYEKKESGVVTKAGESQYNLIETTIPMRLGQPLAFIPFVFFGATNLTPNPDQPPLGDLCEINLSHYRSSADLEHGRHFTALPTPWAAGFDIKGTLQLGSSTAWISDDPQAKCGFLEFEGKGLESLEKALVEKQEQMAILGARLLEAPKSSVEAADTHKIRKSSEQAVVASIASTLDTGIETCLNWLKEWASLAGEVEYEMNKDFGSVLLDAQMLAALVAAYQSQTVSYATLFKILQRAGITEEGATAEEEMALIQAGGLNLVPYADRFEKEQKGPKQE